MTLADVLLLVLGIVVVAYVLTGGADFGAGVWDLLAFGPRARAQREVIEHALAPIWEVNHIWMIFAVVLLFSGFPVAFAVVTTALHVPILLALVGIVLRGAAFTFRAYGMEPDERRAIWGRVFAWSSLVTPLFLGMVLGGLSSGEIRVVDGQVVSGFFVGWTSAYSLLVGCFALASFALLAAVYLCVEAEGAVQEDFRRRALASEIVAGVLAAVVAIAASFETPHVFQNLLGSPWSMAVQLCTAACAATTIAALFLRRWKLARAAVVCQIALVIVGWQLAMGGFLVLPDVSLADAGTRDEVVAPLLAVVLAGAVVLAPALYWLFRVFKSSRDS